MRNYHNFLSKYETAMPSWNRLEVIASEYRTYKKEANRNLRVLDIGCGRNAYLTKLISKEDFYVGCDYYPSVKKKIGKYVQIDLNEESLSNKMRGDVFDVIFCGEVIEHLFSPDDLLDEMKKLMHKDSILIISTPNLGYYVNRILLLFGISPLFLENSSRYKLGRKLKSLGQGNITEGHIRVFTYGALKDLFKLKQLNIVRVRPVTIWGFWLDRIFSRLSKSFSPDNVFVLQKKQNKK
ncbi:MAG: methyltransferase domain-containing protein [Candidatus Levybacteria bacterium]|nr:methyltransferase domain-containing protein [Candidatus Levybacteria bacterium]